MSDTFALVALEDIGACQHVVRTILGTDDIRIVSVKGQYRLLNLTSAIPYDDGNHVVFANAAVNDGSEAARLMQYFKNADPNV